MNQVIEFFLLLFNVDDWPARWNCGHWSEFHGWLYITSDIFIWLAYFIIPAIIVFYIQKRANTPFLPVYWLFGGFIILCGSTHLIDAIIFWWPAYRLSALLRLLTAIISIATAFALIRELPRLLDMQSIDDLEISRLKLQLKEREQEISMLKKQIRE